MLEANTGTDPCQVGRQRRYQTVLQVAANDPIISPPIPGIGGGGSLGEHDHLSAVSASECSLPLGLDAQSRLISCPQDIAWWVITVHALEVIRENPIPGNKLTPLELDQIIALGRPTSLLKARAILSDTTVRQTIRDFDIGHDNTFTWRGPSVEIRVLTGQEGGPSESRPDGLAGFTIIDTLVQASASPVIWGTGLTQIQGLTHSQTVNAQPGITQCVPIPRGARRVQIYQAGGPAIVPVWTITFGTGPTLLPIGVTSAIGTSFSQGVPGNATDLCFTLGGGMATQITFVWELLV